MINKIDDFELQAIRMEENHEADAIRKCALVVTLLKEVHFK